MANELKAQAASGQTLYAVLIGSDGSVWNVDSAVWEEIDESLWPQYAILLTEAGGASGLYLADLPSGVSTTARLSLLVYAQSGGDPAAADACIAQGALGPAPAELGVADDAYFADVQFTRDTRSAPPRDEYTVAWFKNAVPLSAGVTSATLHAVRRADGTSLLGPAALTQVGATGVFKLDATEASRQPPGEAVIVVVAAMIDGATRTWRKVLGRDTA